MPIEHMGFADALVERLHLAQIERVGELVVHRAAKLVRFPSLGPRSLQVIRRVLNDHGLDLGGSPPANEARGRPGRSRYATKEADRIDGEISRESRTPLGG
jgi:DNA-directed RNA polymerase alpha subunit